MYVYNIITLRDQKVHISGVMLMCIIHRLQKRTNSAYLGEVATYYRQERNERFGKGYTDGGIYAQLNTLVNRGMVKISKHGRCNNYDLTAKGKINVCMFTGER